MGLFTAAGFFTSKPLRDGPREVRLARAELTDERDHRAGEQQLPEPPAEGLGRREIGDVDSSGHKRQAAR